MSRIAYVNGAYRRFDQACIHIEDRGYQFADGVYEVCKILNGKVMDADAHWARLMASLQALGIAMPVSERALASIVRTLIAKNRLREGALYVQVSRGVAARNHIYPTPAPPPALVMTARRLLGPAMEIVNTGVAVQSMPDIRWSRRDIKSIALLPNVLCKNVAVDHGYYEAVLLDNEGQVTECSASNAWIITKDNVLVTRPNSHSILPGITKSVVLRLAAEIGLAIEERTFNLQEMKEAKEAFLTSTTSYVLPIIRVDDCFIGNGHPGAHATKLRSAYISHLEKQAYS
jgi:D-alanine transaminase